MINKHSARRLTAIAGLTAALLAGGAGFAGAEAKAPRTVSIQGLFVTDSKGVIRSTGDFLGTYTFGTENVGPPTAWATTP